MASTSSVITFAQLFAQAELRYTGQLGIKTKRTYNKLVSIESGSINRLQS
ncbi:hypothetical protein BH11ARM1_BH11ARM1_02430 [soil metagenome]